MPKSYPKIKRIQDRKYLSYLRTLPCALCGRFPTESAHQRLLGGGIGIKPNDRLALPECYECHRLGEHAINGGILTVWNERSGMKFTDKHDLRDFLEVACKEYYEGYIK